MKPRAVLAACLLSACGGADHGTPPFQAVTSTPAIGIALTWTAPTKNTDGTQLTDIAGYRIAWGASAGALTNVVNVPAAPLAFVLRGMAAGGYFVTVSTVNSAGQSSDPSTPLAATAAPTP